jgi:hypothetical protein
MSSEALRTPIDQSGVRHFELPEGDVWMVIDKLPPQLRQVICAKVRRQPTFKGTSHLVGDLMGQCAEPPGMGQNLAGLGQNCVPDGVRESPWACLRTNTCKPNSSSSCEMAAEIAGDETLISAAAAAMEPCSATA